MRPLVHCPHCGLLFLSHAIDVNVGYLYVAENKEHCPRCGQWAVTPTAVYRLLKEAEEIARDPESTPEILKAAGELAEQAAFQKRDPITVAAEAARISPRMGGLFGRVAASLNSAIVVSAALATIGAFFLAYQARQSAEDSQRRTEDLLKQLIETQQPKQRQPDKDPAIPRPGAIPKEHRHAGNGKPGSHSNRHARRRAASIGRKKR